MSNKTIYVMLFLVFGFSTSLIFNVVNSFELKESYRVNRVFSDHIDKSDFEISKLKHKLEFGY